MSHIQGSEGQQLFLLVLSQLSTTISLLGNIVTTAQ